MLRWTLYSITVRHAVRRNYAAATAAKKRALVKSQSLQGGSLAGGASTPPPTTPPSSTLPPYSGGGESSLLPVALVGLVAAGGAAYYFDVIPGLATPEAKPREMEGTLLVKQEDLKELSDTLKAEKSKSEVGVVEEEKKVAPAAVGEETEVVVANVGNRVVAIQVPSMKTVMPPAVVPPPVEHPPKGNRVIMKPPPSEEASTEAALEELDSRIAEETDATLQEARKRLRNKLDDSLFGDLEQMSAGQLKIRVVQLAAEMEERTKWEAVRLKDFLAMKEKETADKYMAILQKQRLEFEDILASKLREQEDALSRQANVALQQKEESIQAVLSAAVEAQEAEHKADLESTEERLISELNAKYQEEYLGKLVEEKASYVKELEDKVATINDLANQLKNLEMALQVSRSFESGSLAAHRMSAAALAFAEKLQTSQGAAIELEALKAAAVDDEVILSAISIVPVSVSSGIPTLPELQTRFETVYKRSRQAAMVPAGRVGLDGQLMGILFSSMKYAPDPDDAAPEDTKDSAEYLLARARRHVQLGELERAIEQLEKLEGQPAFTVQDWTKDAKDRVAAEKAAKVIKMECAVLNESLSSLATSSE